MKNTRQRAWRNMMVAAINIGLDRGFFGLRPGNNFWKDAANGSRCIYLFEVDGVSAIASVKDASIGMKPSDELRINVAFWPTSDAAEWVASAGSGTDPTPGEAHAGGWVARKDTAWLEVPLGRVALFCRKDRLATVAAFDIQTQGYADNGPFW